MLVAGNDRVQTIISQLEDSSRVTKVRGQNNSAWGFKASSAASGVKTHPWFVVKCWILEPGLFKQGWLRGTD